MVKELVADLASSLCSLVLPARVMDLQLPVTALTHGPGMASVKSA